MPRIRRGPRIALIALAAAIVVFHVVSYIGGWYAASLYARGDFGTYELTNTQLAVLTVVKFCWGYVWLLWVVLILVAAWAFLSRRPRVEVSPAS